MTIRLYPLSARRVRRAYDAALERRILVFEPRPSECIPLDEDEIRERQAALRAQEKHPYRFPGASEGAP